MSELDQDTFFFFHDVREYIEKHGADKFVQQFHSLFPHHSHALSSAILHDHASDYDKKKAALLKKHI